MTWRVVERKIGPAGSAKRREARQREWDRKYGDWEVGYVVDGDFLPRDVALESIYYRKLRKAL